MLDNQEGLRFGPRFVSGEGQAYNSRCMSYDDWGDLLDITRNGRRMVTMAFIYDDWVRDIYEGQWRVWELCDAG